MPQRTVTSPERGQVTYATAEIVRLVVRDLVADIRRARRDGLVGYAKAQREFLSAVFHSRHTVRLDRYGWPIVNPPLRS